MIRGLPGTDLVTKGLGRAEADAAQNERKTARLTAWTITRWCGGVDGAACCGSVSIQVCNQKNEHYRYLGTDRRGSRIRSIQKLSIREKI